MASITINQSTLIAPLWGKEISTKGNGLAIAITIQDGIAFTRVAFSPFDSSRFACGTTDGGVYTVTPKRNKLVLVASLVGPVSALCWVKPDVILASAQQSMHLILTDVGRVDKKTKSPHISGITSVAFHCDAPMFAASISRETLAVWDVTKLECRSNTKQNVVHRSPSEFVAVALQGSTTVVTAESTGVVTQWTLHDLQTMRRVSIAPHRPVSISWFNKPGGLLLFGTSGNQLVELDGKLDGLTSVQLPGSTSVLTTVIIEGDVLAAATTEGHAWFVATADHSVCFSLSHPSSATPIDFAVGGATYAVVATHESLFMFHLPTVKLSYDRTISKAVTATSRHSSSHYGAAATSTTTLLPFVRKATDTTPELNSASSESFKEPLPRGLVQIGEGQDQEWVKVNLATHHDAVAGVGYPQPLGLREAVKQMNAADVIAAKKGGASKCSVISQQGKATTKSSTSAADSSSKRKNAKRDEFDDLGHGAPSNVSLRMFLDHESRVVNMDKLRVMLLRYGVFPEKYRALIWRFLLQLPEKKFLAPQFASLSDKGKHPGTETLLKPFPLPDKKMRTLLQQATNILSWCSPVFSVAHFTPTLVFPFVKFFGSDLQSAVEVSLAFTINWGQEFFKYYPHHPVGVVSFLNHMLKLEDLELWTHLDQVGVGPEVWGWLVLSPLYTEVLTRNEWFQVMDHAFANEPLWLFLFHVRWMCQIRGPLLQLHDYTQLSTMFRKTSPVNLNAVIHQTYRLQQRCVHSDLTEPYRKLNTFPEGSYPVLIEHDEAIVTSKVREMEKIAAHEDEARAVRSRISEVQRQTIQSAMVEDAFVGRQRAVVAAKLESANETWMMQVQMEKDKQRLRDIEHEARLTAVQEQLRTAQRLESLQMELGAAAASAKDADVDRQREETKWAFSERMSTHEIERLEIGARMKLSTMMATSNALGNSVTPYEILQPSAAAAGRAVPAGGGGMSSSAMRTEQGNERSLSQSQPSPAQQSLTPNDATPPLRSTRAQQPAAPVVVAAPRSPPPPIHIRPASVPKEQSTMTEQPSQLPPMAPLASTRNAIPPDPPSQIQVSASCLSAPDAAQQSSSATTDTTSMPTSSCDADPISYYRQLHEQIKTRVEATQREQAEALTNLRSRFARQLVAEESHSTASSVAAESTQSRRQVEESHQRQTTTTTTHVHQAQTTVTAAEEVQQDRMDTLRDYAESNDSSSISRALLRPQNPALFDLND